MSQEYFTLSCLTLSCFVFQTKKVLAADSRRDSFMHLMNERKHSLSRIVPQYIPLQGAYRPPTPLTMLVPPSPPTHYIPTTSNLETTSSTTTTTTTTTPRPTTFATPEATTSATSQIHKVGLQFSKPQRHSRRQVEEQRSRSSDNIR